jgi:hypothetical protein
MPDLLCFRLIFEVRLLKLFFDMCDTLNGRGERFGNSLSANVHFPIHIHRGIVSDSGYNYLRFLRKATIMCLCVLDKIGNRRFAMSQYLVESSVNAERIVMRF